MRAVVAELAARMRFDSIVCDFLTPAVNVPDMRSTILFQHNVETMIWRRHADTARNPFARAYLRRQAARMEAFERAACRLARHVIAVSEADATAIREMSGREDVSAVPTGVDVDYFQRPEASAPQADLVFVGSMDWLPNQDAIRFFVGDVLPLIRAARPDTSLAVVGRNPGRDLRAMAARDPRIAVTGTVPDVRPYFWGARLSIVPLRVGGGTRLKIFEAMAAGTPVVSTSVGAEGLEVTTPDHLRLADTAAEFADQCVQLLEHRDARDRTAAAALQLVRSRFGWGAVVQQFEALLMAHRLAF